MSGTVAIVGAGLAGALLGTMLGHRGYDVTMYERRSDPRAVGAERGRSINLAISTRGLTALAEVGLRDAVLDRGLPMRGRMLHDELGRLEFQAYSADGQRAINSISRGELNAVLLDAAEALPTVRVAFDHRLTSLDVDARRMTFQTPGGDVVVEADAIIGSDGAFSAVRQQLQRREGFDFSQDYLSHYYKELTIPAVDGDFALDPGALHIWPRGGSMMIALPNLDRSFTCTLFWPRTGPGSFGELTTPQEIRAFFDRHYGDASALMPNLVDDYELNPIGALLTVRCFPWSIGSVGLIGDAAHAICPFYGQGANASFEDCIALVHHLDASGGDWARALPAYETERKPNADAIADLALFNFVEMSQGVRSPAYKAVRTVEHGLHRVLGERYRTRYEMVSFSTMPYADIEPTLRRQRLAAAAAGAGLAVAGALGVRALRR